MAAINANAELTIELQAQDTLKQQDVRADVEKATGAMLKVKPLSKTIQYFSLKVAREYSEPENGHGEQAKLEIVYPEWDRLLRM